MYKRKHLLSLNKTTIFYLLLIILNIPFVAYSQQEPQFTQYMYNRLSYNPGYAGSNGAICLTAFNRNQWMGLKLRSIEGKPAPSTPQIFNASIDLPISLLHGGLGATIISENVGYWNQTFFKIDYAYRFELPTGNLAIGLEAQMFNSAIDFASLVASDQIDELDRIGYTRDPILRDASQQNDFLFDLGFGAYYQIPGKFYAGLSTSKLLETKSEKLKWEDQRHYYILAGYEWVIPAYPSFRVLPSTLLKIVEPDKVGYINYQIDATAILEYNYMFWGGLNYRIDDAFSILGGLSIAGFKFGLAYDIPTTSKVARSSYGSFDIFLRYCFKIESKPKPPTSYRNTRRN